jgi:hypothetical protein
VQTITTTTTSGVKTEVLINKSGAPGVSTMVLENSAQSITSADGKVITINRDSNGSAVYDANGNKVSGWFDQQEIRTTNTDGSRTTVIKDLASNGATIRSSSE